jgi:hypothetical protein
MRDLTSLKGALEQALVVAYAAVEELSEDRVACARILAADVVATLDQAYMSDFTLSEARQIVLLLSQLRAVLDVIDRRLHRLHAGEAAHRGSSKRNL